jgi:GNAT superfamily N-acetyltransferase
VLSVVQLARRLPDRPLIVPVPGITLRPYGDPGDVERWLELRRRAFARQRLGVRDWQAADFAREFLEKPWWRPEHMWFAEARSEDEAAWPVGTVTLAQRDDGNHPRPVVHWLAVLPSHRRRGIGRLLISALEAAVWDAGGRQVWLETHAAWAEAARLYESLGYEPWVAERAL